MAEEAGGNFLTQFIGGVAKPLIRPAQQALSAIVGAHWPEVLARAQAARDLRDGKSLVSRAVAEAAAKMAASDDALVQQTMHHLLNDAVEKQQARVEIGLIAVQQLSEHAGDAAAGGDVDPDWLNLFGGYAERASSDRMKETWARVLSGEIRRPGAFSLRTLQFVATLDAKTAAAMMRVFPFIFDRDTILPESAAQDLAFDDVVHLRDVGLLGHLGGDVEKTLTRDERGLCGVPFQARGLRVDTNPDGPPVTLSCVSISQIAVELIDVVAATETDPALNRMIEVLSRMPNVLRISRGDIEGGALMREVVMWSRSSTSPNAI